MKRLLITSALILSTATAALATTAATELPANIRADVQRLVPEANLSDLSGQQIGAITTIFANSDNYGSDNAPEGTIRAILNWN